ncbi:hypothetical protein FGG08_007137 [Glutinoglossum americanum]|uniref:Azaphilone pigments biosynthesis cluster protein L N-terminal domain-containing protein n=1 Tax=Glutinoglossum americanum TaxID=1670608 RepID=A0A9P8I5Z1_9PEZI|nr:hypothetical protein FGG08_007137 [Glutinoglossum americanum]
MVEPLSIVSGVIAVVTAATQVGKILEDLVRGLVRVPHELSELLDEVSQLRIVFSHLVHSEDVPEESVSAISRLTANGITKLRELERFAESFIRSGYPNIILTDKIRWRKERRKMKDLKNALYSIRCNLSVLLIAKAVSGIEIVLNGISEVEKIREEQKEALGHLVVGISSLDSFKEQSTAVAQISYCFPKWLLMRVVSFVVTKTSVGDPVACLKVRRSVPVHADILRLASLGEVSNMTTLFEKRTASPMDISISDGRSVLHTAVNTLQLGACKFLIHAGADPFLEDHNGRSAMDVAWSKILSKSGDSTTLEELRNLFADDSCLEKFQLTPLQKIVVGLADLELGKQLSLSTATIDDTDAYSRTALLWATIRGDGTAVEALLQYGADPNICDVDGASPLHFASHCATPTAIGLLIEKGAMVNKLDKWHHSPITNTSFFRDDISYLRPLVAGGADINARDYWQESSLNNAAIKDHYKVALYLIELGAMIDNEDVDGDTPLLDSIHHNSHRCLSLLLSYGADYTRKNRWGRTVLHQAAIFADIQTLQIITEDNLCNVSIDTRSNNGFTAAQLAANREDAPDGFLAKFEAMIKSVQSTRIVEIGSVSSEGDSESDEFEDAVEHQIEGSS